MMVLRPLFVLAIGIAVVVPTASAADGPNQGRISWSLSSDVTTAYMFRGILQERDGFIWQPAIELGVNLFQREEGPIASVDLGMGVWSSIHEEKTLAGSSGPSNLYEVDYYPSLSIGLANGLTTSLAYVVYTGPNGSFDTIQQLDLSLSLDDSAWMGAFALNPSALFSFELDRTSFGDEEGKYFEIGVGPGFEWPLGQGEDAAAVAVTFPVAAGFSMGDYYETLIVDENDHVIDRDDETFGFVSFGLRVDVPLTFIPSDYGAWTTGAGFNLLVLSDTLEDVNEGDGVMPVGTWNVSLAY